MHKHQAFRPNVAQALFSPLRIAEDITSSNNQSIIYKHEF